MLGTTLIQSGILGLALVAAPPTASAQDGPPGMVLVKGGKTKVGTTVKDAEKIIAANDQSLSGTIAGETPLTTFEVDDFYLMVTEVTSEQYAEYVEATGAKPPYLWGEEALEAARAAFVEEQGLARKEAREKGELFESKKFDKAKWWDENWQDCEWEVPEDQLDRPVVYIDYKDAQGYARWAGVRLMTEQEYQRAARGDSDRVYPWGDDWEDGQCNSLEHDRDGTVPVGGFAEAAAPNGIYDLVGNVWEWTSSPYVKFHKDYKPIDIKVRRGGVDQVFSAMAGFDPNFRSVVGGSYSQTQVGVRIATRMGADRGQTTEGLGFRCAASLEPGRDKAAWILDDDVNLAVLPGDTDFDLSGTIPLHRWAKKEGTSKIPGYGVIASYESTLFCPVANVGASSVNELRKNSAEHPVFLGFLELAQTSMVPELDAGTYLIAWRGQGKLRDKDSDEAEEGDEPLGTISFSDAPGFDPEVDCVFFYTLEGAPIVAIPSEPAEFKKLRGLGSVAIEPFVAPTPEELEKLEEEGMPAPVPMDTLRFSLRIVGKRPSSPGLMLDLPIGVRPGTYDDSWRTRQE